MLRRINNFKSLLGLETSKQAQERLSTEQTETKELKEAAYSQPGAFKAKFERAFGRAYSYENIENLKKKSDEFINATVMHESYTNLTAGINDINKTILKERNTAAMQKHAVNDTLKMPKPSSEEKFAVLLKDFCKGDDRIFSQYMEKLKQKYGSDANIKENLPEILENLQNSAEQAYKKQLKGVDVEYYQNEYNEACKKAIGRQDAETLAKKLYCKRQNAGCIRSSRHYNCGFAAVAGLRRCKRCKSDFCGKKFHSNRFIARRNGYGKRSNKQRRLFAGKS